MFVATETTPEMPITGASVEFGVGSPGIRPLKLAPPKVQTVPSVAMRNGAPSVPHTREIGGMPLSCVGVAVNAVDPYGVRPHLQTRPSNPIAQLVERVTNICAMFDRPTTCAAVARYGNIVPDPNSPSSLYPHDQTVPSLLRARAYE